jgi:hypothetical protein
LTRSDSQAILDYAKVIKEAKKEQTKEEAKVNSDATKKVVDIANSQMKQATDSTTKTVDLNCLNLGTAAMELKVKE